MLRKIKCKANNKDYNIMYVKAYTQYGEFFKGNMSLDAIVISFSFSKNNNGVISFDCFAASKKFQQLIVSGIEKNEEDKSNQH